MVAVLPRVHRSDTGVGNRNSVVYRLAVDRALSGRSLDCTRHRCHKERRARAKRSGCLGDTRLILIDHGGRFARGHHFAFIDPRCGVTNVSDHLHGVGNQNDGFAFFFEL